MLAFGLFDKIWPQLLSAVWHHVRRTWKTGNPIPQIFRKKAKKKKRQRVFYIILKIFLIVVMMQASNGMDFFVIFISWLQMGFFCGGESS